MRDAPHGKRSEVERVRSAVFETGSEIVRYFELLPPGPLRDMYDTMMATADPEARRELQDRLREFVRPGPIDVNIMTKLDRDHDRRGRRLPERCSDALSAFRGFMNSKVDASVVLSAGMNRRLFNYLAEFPDFLPDDAGRVRKKIVLKVGDFRSALIQGKLLAQKGLWVSEYRIESGLNCGGHAFGGKVGHRLPIVGEERRQIPVSALDPFVHWQALDHIPGEPGRLDHALARGDADENGHRAVAHVGLDDADGGGLGEHL